jgi:hypothetical protein
MSVWHAIDYKAGVSPYLEQVVQEGGHVAMETCLVELLQQVQQRGDVSQQAPQQVSQTLRVACHVMQNLEASFCFQRRTFPFCYNKRVAFEQKRPKPLQTR